MMNDKQLDNLNTLANILQIYNTMLLQQDESNNDLLQDIIQRLERIENLLTKIKNSDNGHSL